MKIILIILCLLSSLSFTPNKQVFAASKYAQVQTSTNIYKLTSTSDSIQNVFCIAEKSYFVEILGEYDNTYRINYNGISGYVKKHDVREIIGHPVTPYPQNITLTIASDCNFRSSPFSRNDANNIITTLKAGQSDFTFIGRIFSEEAIDFGGTTWYFVNYQGQYGYIYNKYVKSITPIYENQEKVNYTKHTNELINPITHTPSIIIIIILFLPCLGILIILYLPRKYTHRTKPKKIKEPKITFLLFLCF
jgi:hypothetical protein